MKNSKEITATVLKKRDEHVKRSIIKRQIMKKVAYIGSTICASIIVVTGAIHFNGSDMKKIPISDFPVCESTQSSAIAIETSEDVKTQTSKTSESTEIPPTNSSTTGIDTEMCTDIIPIVTNPNPIEETDKQTDKPSTSFIPSTTKSVEITTTVPSTESEIVTEPKWNEMTLTQQFPEFAYNNNLYGMRNVTIGTEYVDEYIENLTLSTFDELLNVPLSVKCNIYSVANISTECVVALKFEESSKYYLYFNQDYCPDSLGALIDDLDFKNTVALGEFYYGYDPFTTYPVTEYQTNQLLLLLDSNRQVFYEDDTSFHKNKVSFSTNLDLLGIFGKSMVFTEDGYFITNIMELQYTFYIGEDKMADFMFLFDSIQSSFTESNYNNETTEIIE